MTSLKLHQMPQLPADIGKKVMLLDPSTDTIVDSKAAISAVDVVPVAEEVEEVVLPAKKGYSSLSRWLNLIFFSYYRKIFSIVFFANLGPFIYLTMRNKGAPKASETGNAASANLMVAILFRQEDFVNLVYELAVACPHSAPLWIRRRLAKVFHYGGAHSGAGTAAVVWYIMYTAITTKDFIVQPNSSSLATMITAYVLVVMFVLILAGAHPRFRVMYHDHFEAMHRYAGWTALVTFWIQTVFAANEYRALEDPIHPLGAYLVRTPSLWMLSVSTGCIILSWARLRRYEVYPETLSSHATRLHFKYRNMKPFLGLKVSTRPLQEWHAFATIPEVDSNGNPDGFSMIVSNAGDWTNSMIHSPPRKLWIRGAPLYVLLYPTKLFKRIVVVATGSGIGPTLSLFHANITPRRVFWSTPSPEATYGDKVISAVKRADANAKIWDTRKDGRPDMVLETWKLVEESKAEAVYVVSNPAVTRKVVFGMESRGVPAYGAIFDS
ncbi:hypothetical protein VNI00_015587 [Paramarasmius palmivorus]|uniref:Nonribosomal peptide synthetase 12 n=1 Tax=Paramarasmius palmivorus TaxID=297713 RepID=A0AAW0BKH7_9AGAR